MNVLFISLIFGIAVVSANPVQLYEPSPDVIDWFEEQWNHFKELFNKTYESDKEHHYRFNQFKRNLDIIRNHNKEFAQGIHSYWLDLNEFADWGYEDLTSRNGFRQKKTLLGASPSAKGNANRSVTWMSPLNVNVPDEVDWRDKGYVTEVKNQGSCGSCWAFSTTGSLEGQSFRKTGKLPDLSEQQLVDCSRDYGNMGCNGGEMDFAFQYIKDVGGIEDETDYPYDGVDEKCAFIKGEVAAEDTGYVDVTSEDEDALKTAVATVGPVSVAIDANHYKFMFYSGGVFDEKDCSQESLDHGVLAVGYGTDKETSKDFWIVKNSWGTTWGEKGYVRMRRNAKNQCGIATSASYPLV